MASQIPPTGDPEVDGIVSVVNKTVSGLQKQFPRGTIFGNWLSDFGNLGQAWSDIKHMLFGYTYTGGDYALGEVFQVRVQGIITNNRWDTPDGIVPIAWYFFTDLLGLPIAVNTDLDTLASSDSLEAYLNGRPEQRGYVTQAQVSRAHQLMQLLYQFPRESGWSDMRIFSLLPYVAPIPDARTPGMKLTGALPNGQQIVNGLPTTNATGNNSNVKISSTSTGSSSTLMYVVIAIAIIVLLFLILS